jgi:hypothetical protein
VPVGDGFWEHEPSADAVGMLGDLTDLATTLDRVTDDYEWAWTGSPASWALDRPTDPDSARVPAAATEHRDGSRRRRAGPRLPAVDGRPTTAWLRGYRDVLGFVCLVLRPR